MKQIVFIGTYTYTAPNQPHRKEGIYIYQVQPGNGEMQFLSAVEDIVNPSFLAIHPDHQYFYAVNELDDGQVSALRVDPESGLLELINQQLTYGSAPCYISFDASGRFVMVSNYGNGTLSIFPILEDGALGICSDHVIHAGTGPDRNRQETAHAHSIISDPTGNFILAADLGIDQVLIYHLEQDTGKLVTHQPAGLSLPPGSGPRHMAFDPTGKFLYIANELGNTVTACTWDSEKGTLDAFQTLPTLPFGFVGANSVADIHITPDGRFLYVSNRGHHSLAIYQVLEDGSLIIKGHSSSGGQWPRNFAILPAGDRLIVANEHSDNIVLHDINSKNGQLQSTGLQYTVPKPVCVLPVSF